MNLHQPSTELRSLKIDVYDYYDYYDDDEKDEMAIFGVPIFSHSYIQWPIFLYQLVGLDVLFPNM